MMRLRKFLNGSMAMILVFLLVAGCGSRTPAATAGNETTNEATEGILLIGTDATFPPFESLDSPRRKIIGFDIDLINAIADKAGFKVEIVGTRYGLLLENIATCQMDAGISAIPITEELQQEMLFSDPYFTNGQVVVVKKGNLTIKGEASMAGMIVGAQKGTPSVNLVSQLNSIQLMTYSAAEFAFRDLAEGLIDAVVADKLLALSYVGVKPNNLKIVGEEFSAERYGIAICKQEKDLLEKINKGLAEVKADGTFNQLEKKWLNAP
jgi:polar amino acid transport system substrate-binding protein